MHAGRGSAFQYNLSYNSLIWLRGGGSTPKWTPPTHFAFGWFTDGPAGILQFQANTSGACPLAGGQSSNYAFTDQAGTTHAFTVTPCQTGFATDASGYNIDLSKAEGPIVRGPDGTKYLFGGGGGVIGGVTYSQGSALTDANGNRITSTVNSQTNETDWTDTLGQTVLKVTSQFNNLNGSISETDYSRLAGDQSYQTIAVKYQLFSIHTNFGCAGVAEFITTATPLVSEIDLPNGQKYLFTYEPTPGSPGSVTGRLQQIKLPTGGTITYQYPGANGGINCADGAVLGLSRTVNDGVTSSTWSYTRVQGTLQAGVTTVTAPQLPYDTFANQTVVTFDTKGRETSRQIYQGTVSSTPLRTLNTNWNVNNTPASRTVILEDGSTQSQEEMSYDSDGNAGLSTGKLLQVKEHDWGSGAPGPVLRTTTQTYLNGPAYVSANIVNRVQTRTVADATGVKYRIDTNYDEPGFVNTNCITGALQHDDANYGCSFTTRGLPTSDTTYTDAATPSGGVTKRFSYDSVGNLVSMQVNNSQQMQRNFSSGTQYAFPDSVVKGPIGGPQTTTSATYNLATGQIATLVDENLQVTTFTYNDPGHLDRLTDIQRPDNAHIVHTYDDIQRIFGIKSPIQGTNATQKLTTFDSLGRPVTETTKDASNNIYSIVATQYDVVGRPYMSSNPYTTSPQFFTTRQFDALGRPTITLLPDGAQGTASYSTNAVTIADPATKQKKSYMDGLGHLTRVDEPGDAFLGSKSSGSITISGTLGSKSGVNSTSGSGSVTISGTVGFRVICTRTCTTIYNTGVVTVAVQIPGGTVSKQTSIGQAIHSAGAVANDLAQKFSQDSHFRNVNVVMNSSTSYTLNLTASATGSATNYPYIASSGSDLTATAAGPAFTNGTDGQTIFDSGTIIVQIGNFSTAPICYGQSCNSTSSAVANAVAAALGAQGSPVGQVSVAGSTISMTANQPSSSWNVAVTATPTSGDPADFPQGSFASQGSLSGGADPYSAGLAHPFSTFYSYGVLDNLLQVSQGVQTRTYAYDGMGRMTDATTPEAGHVILQYNAFDLVSQQTDARGVKTNYGYDTLNRLHQLSYDAGTTGVPATPAVTYNYGTNSAQNNNGRLLSIIDGLGSETYTYDILGKTTQLQKVIDGVTYTIGYGYNLAGEVTSITYPSGHVIQQSFDAIGRLCEIAPVTTGCGTATAPYASAYSYNTAFETTAFNFGNGVNAAFSFSPDRLQLTGISYVKEAQTLFGLNYFYKQDSVNCPTGATNNNGQIQCIIDNVDSGRTASYAYDLLGRLASAATHGSASYPALNITFAYDRYGNRTAQNSSTVSIDPPTNRISTLPYDASGNMVNDGINALVYDAANRLITNTQSSAISTYSYDCKSIRVKKVSGGNTTVYIFSAGKVIAEYLNGAAATAPAREYIYSGDRLLAKVEAGAVSYYQPDHLSTRVITDANGVSIGQQGTLPFGDPWYDAPNYKWKFTSYERDFESQNDYAMARYYINRYGRFGSPDPAPGVLAKPQTLNGYGYTANDPVNSIDPTGMVTIFPGRGWYIGAATVFGSENSHCMVDGLSGPCITGGNTLFDALAGSPGTFVTIGAGQIGFGFDEDLWRSGHGVLDSVQAGVALHNSNDRLPTLITDMQVNLVTWVYQVGMTSWAEGYIPDLMEIAAETKRLLAEWPASVRNAGSPGDILDEMIWNVRHYPQYDALMLSQAPYWDRIGRMILGLGQWVNVTTTLRPRFLSL
jgi:RHS repeat-associated protein